MSTSNTTLSSSANKGSVLNFNLSADEIKQKTERIIEECNEICTRVASQTDPTFENSVALLGYCENTQFADINLVPFLQYVSTDSDVRDASTEAEEKLDAYDIEMWSREDLYKVVKAVYDNTFEMDKLDAEDCRLIDKIMLKFERSGLGLSKGDREQLADYRKQISELEIKYNRNINESDARILLTREQLAGLPDSFFEDRETESIDGVEKYIVTMKTPDIVPVLRYAKDERVRREILLADSRQCPENSELLQKTIGLRAKAAQLLGYKSHAEYVISEKMAKTPENVIAFTDDLRKKVYPLARIELAEREELKKADKNASGEEFKGLFRWDVSYYSNIIKERKHNINMEEVKTYFSFKSVARGILDIYQSMLSLRFVKVENPPVWHPDVEMYEVWEATNDSFIGHFYLDLFPRENKYNHAAMWSIRAASASQDGSSEYPVSVMVANFPKATSTTPALMQHDDVVTFMHEMGHVFHRICSRTKWSRFHGTSVEGDFVEAPSQMLENWAWEPSVLQKFAVHYKTGEAIPEDLIKRLVASKNASSGIYYLRQIMYGSYDMAIHNTSNGEIDVKKTYIELTENITMLTEDGEDTWEHSTFGHVMSGYSAGYYGYLWSEVYSADMYETRFRKDGVDNTQTGLDYRREILLPGSSRDASISLKAFLGREPQNDAFLKSIGLFE